MTEQEINNLIDSKIGKTKMSQLPEATQTSGLYSIGYNGNQSVKYKANLLQGDPLTVRKTYQTEAEALADKNPIDTTTSLPLKVGQFVSIVDDGEKNGIYRIGSIGGDGTMSLELQGKVGDLSEYTKTGGSTKTTKEIDDTKANHGYPSAPKTLKEVEDNASVKIENLVVNGGFESGVPSWISASPILSEEEKLSGGSSGYVDLVSGASYSAVDIACDLNDKLYISVSRRFKSVVEAGTNSIRITDFGSIENSISLAPFYNGNLDVWETTTAIVNGRTNGVRLRVGFFSGSAVQFFVDNLIAVNLTETFGTGNEPTKEEFELLLDILGIDFFEGEITIPAQKIMQWLLELQGEYITADNDGKTQKGGVPIIIKTTPEKVINPDTGETLERFFTHELKDEHIIRRLSNGVKDEITTRESGEVFKTARLGKVVLDGNEAWSDIKGYPNIYTMRILNWMEDNNAKGITGYEIIDSNINFQPVSTIGNSSVSGYYLTIRMGFIEIGMDKTFVDNLDGVNNLTKCINALKANPITLTYELATPEIVEFPINKTANTEAIIDFEKRVNDIDYNTSEVKRIVEGELKEEHSLRKLTKEIADEISYNDDGTPYKIAKIGRVVLDGSELWGNYTGHQDYSVAAIDDWMIDNNAVGSGANEIVESDNPFTVVTRIGDLSTSLFKIALSGDTGKLWISFPRDFLTDNYTNNLSGIKKALLDKPVTLYYALAEPLEVQLPSKGLTANTTAIIRLLGGINSSTTDIDLVLTTENENWEV